jgi:hypothetical protein
MKYEWQDWFRQMEYQIGSFEACTDPTHSILKKLYKENYEPNEAYKYLKELHHVNQHQ